VSNPKIPVLGAGGIGGYFGGRLVESGADVTFLVREGRRKILSEQGLQIESPFGDAQLAVETVVASDVAPIYDAVTLTCKAYDLDTAVAAIAPAVAPTGYVLPLPERYRPYRRPEPKARPAPRARRNCEDSINTHVERRNPPIQRLADAHLWRAVWRDDGTRENAGSLVRCCEGRRSLRGHRHRSADVGKAGSPIDRCCDDLSDAGECWRDCPHSQWPRAFPRPASVWCRHRSRQRSRAQRGLYEVVGGDVLPTGLIIRDVDAA